jgi:hypothetical protein
MVISEHAGKALPGDAGMFAATDTTFFTYCDERRPDGYLPHFRRLIVLVSLQKNMGPFTLPNERQSISRCSCYDCSAAPMCSKTQMAHAHLLPPPRVAVCQPTSARVQAT